MLHTRLIEKFWDFFKSASLFFVTIKHHQITLCIHQNFAVDKLKESIEEYREQQQELQSKLQQENKINQGTYVLRVPLWDINFSRRDGSAFSGSFSGTFCYIAD